MEIPEKYKNQFITLKRLPKTEFRTIAKSNLHYQIPVSLNVEVCHNLFNYGYLKYESNQTKHNMYYNRGQIIRSAGI